MNNPSYSNLGGSGSRSSGAFGPVTGTIGAAGVCSSIANTFTSSPTNGLPADVNNRMVLLTYGGSGAETNLPCLLTAATSTTITVTAPVGVTLPTDGRAVTVSSGGPFLITVTATAGLASSSYADINSLVDGVVIKTDPSAVYLYPATTLSSGGPWYIQFDFGRWGGHNFQKYFTEFVWTQLTAYSQGTWSLQVSDDASTWVTLNVNSASTFTLGDPALNPVIYTVTHPAAVNGAWPKGYRYVRLLGVSGATAGGNASIYQIQFKIDDWAASTVVDQTALSASESNKLIAIGECYQVGQLGKSPTFKPGIIYADDFSEILDVTSPIGWKGTSIAAEYGLVRMGSASASVAASAGVAYISRTFDVPLDLRGASMIMGLAIKSLSGIGAYGLSVTFSDVNGNFYTDTPCMNLGGGYVGAAGWLPSYTLTLNNGSYALGTFQAANSSPISPSAFDLAHVASIRLGFGDNSLTGTIVFDSLIFPQNPPQAQIGLRVDDSSTISTLMLLDWLSANHPGLTVDVNTDPGLATSASAPLVDSTAGVGNLASPSGSGYGDIITAYQARCSAYKHRLSNHSTVQSASLIPLDYPISANSRVGNMLWQRYILESLGFQPQATRIVSNFVFSEIVQAVFSRYADLFSNADTDENGNISQYATTLLQPGEDIAEIGGAGIPAAVQNACQSCSRYVMFSHMEDAGGSGWGANATNAVAQGYTATSNVLGFGPGWDFDTTQYPHLYSVMSFFVSTVIPAMQGAYGAVPKWINPSQLANVAVPAGGGGGNNPYLLIP